MALEINSEWNAYNKPKNDSAKQEKTIAVGPKNKREEVKHVYSDIEKRWNKKEYLEDNGSIKDDKNFKTPKSFQMYQASNEKK